MSLVYRNASDQGIMPSNREENEVLFESIKAGKKASKRLVEGNMPYVIRMVELFIEDTPTYAYLRDDLMSEGFLTLTKIANLMSHEDVPEEQYFPQALMSVALKNAFLNLVRLEKEVPLAPSMVENLCYSTVAEEELMMDIISLCENDMERQMVVFNCVGMESDRVAELVGCTPRQLRSMKERLAKRCYEVLEIS